MIHGALDYRDSLGRHLPLLGEILRRMVAVCNERVGPPHAARHHHVQIVVQARHGCIGEKEESQIMDRKQLAPCPGGRQHKIRGMKEIQRPTGEPFHPRQRQIQPMPEPHQVALVDGRCMQRQRGLLPHLSADPPSDKEPQIVPRVRRKQRLHLPPDNAPNAGLLANGGGVVDGDDWHE